MDVKADTSKRPKVPSCASVNAYVAKRERERVDAYFRHFADPPMTKMSARRKRRRRRARVRTKPANCT